MTSDKDTTAMNAIAILLAANPAEPMQILEEIEGMVASSGRPHPQFYADDYAYQLNIWLRENR